MDNPIRYEDLFNENVLKGVTDLKNELTSVKNELLSMINQAKAAAKSLGAELAKENGATKAKDIEEVKKAYDKMGVTLEGVTGQLEKLNGATDAVGLTQREMNKVVKLGNEFNSERSESYAQLSKKYQAMKIIINQLTEEERRNNAEAKAMVEESKRIYDQMNMMQQATGKYQLQVGQYGKALNGLQLATNQVIREMPVLSQSFSMFIMAISNNIPILVDEIKKFSAAQKEAAKAGRATIPVWKAMVKSIFSWQTALIVLLTVLPRVIKAVNDKKKAQAELKKSNEELADSVKMVNKALIDSAHEQGEAIAKTHTYYTISMDATRSMDERVEAGKRLKEMYDKELEGLSAEQIAMGEAESIMNNLTASIREQAEARALLNNITDLSSQKMEKELRIRSLGKRGGVQIGALGETVSEASIAELYEIYQQIGGTKKVRSTATSVKGYSGGIVENVIKNFNDATLKMLSEYDRLKKDSKEIDESINTLIDLVDPFALKGTDNGGGGGGGEDKLKEYIEKYEDFFYTAWQAEINAKEDAMAQDLANSDIRYAQDMDKYKQYLADLDKTSQDNLIELGLIPQEHLEEFKRMAEKDREEIEKQENFVLDAMESRRREYYNEQNEIYRKYLKDKKKIAEVEIPKKDKKSFWSLMGFEDDKDGRKYLKGLERVIRLTFQNMQKWIDMRLEIAHIAVEAAQKEVDATKEALDLEQQARVNGYAHNVGLARQEYEERLAIKQKAVEEERKLEEVQRKIDAASQMSSLLVATANLWANYSKMPVVGQVLAGIATAAMFASFAAAQVQASNVVKAKQYGEGMSEYLDYGGSHASGNDIDFGVMKDGTRRRVERGEMVAVINKKNVAKYGVDGVTDIVSSLNSGTFDEKYGLAFAGLGLMNASADLTKVEKGIDTLVSQGEKRIVQGNGYRVEYYKNRKRIIRN